MTDIEIKTRSIYDLLSPTEQKVAWYFLQNMGSVFDEPIATLAEKSGVSQVMWVRFCKALGYSGLKDMKKNLFLQMRQKREDPAVQSMDFLDTKAYSDIKGIISGIEAGALQAVRSTAQSQDTDVLEAVVAKMAAAPTIKLFGVGASGIVAEDLYYKLLRINLNVFFCADFHMQLTYITSLAEGDVALFFSNSGKTAEILEMARAAKEKGAAVVAVTKYGPNPLAGIADFVLPTSSPEIHVRSGATSSRLAALLVVDILFTTLCNQNYGLVEKPLTQSYTLCSRHHV